MQEFERVFFECESKKLFECRVNENRFEVAEEDMLSANEKVYFVRERDLNHLKRCIQMPNVSGLLDEHQISLYHKYGLLTDQEQLDYAECKRDISEEN